MHADYVSDNEGLRVKVKLSLCLCTMPWRHTGGVEIQLRAFLTSSLHGA